MSRFACAILACTNTPPLGTQPLAEGWAYVPHGGVTIGAGWYCPTHAVALAPEHRPTPASQPAPPRWERYTIWIGDDVAAIFCLDCEETITRNYDNGTQLDMYIPAITAHDAGHL